jgi:hypothetical protein
MRVLVPPILALAALAVGCQAFCPPPTTVAIHSRWDTPRMAFETFRDALKAGLPDIVYETLSPDFKKRYGVPGYGKFKIGFQHYRDDFDELGRLLDGAVATSFRTEIQGGRRYAYLTLRSGTAEGDFVLVDIPSWEATIKLEDYDPETVRYFIPGTDFSDVLLVKEGKIYVGPLNAASAGILEASEVRRLAIQHRWHLDDIKRLVNVRPLLERLEQASGGP